MAITTTMLPSAQIVAGGQPRFHVPACAEHPEWAAAVAEETAGGVSADVRAFFDAQLAAGDVVVDAAPGFGFVALSSTTAPGGMPTVFVSGLSDARMQQLQDAAVDVGGWLDELPATALADMAQQVTARLEPEGRVFVHVHAAEVANMVTQLESLADRVLAICVSDAGQSASWPAAEAALARLQLTPSRVVEHDGEAIIVPMNGTAPIGSVIALPSALFAANDA